MPALSASAPGKSILFGEHAVVYGFPAIAVPVKAIQVKATFQPHIGSQTSVICLMEKGKKNEFTITDLKQDNLFKSVISQFQKGIQYPFPPFYLTITSTIPIAAGLGSSAAVSVAVIRGLSQFVGKKMNSDQVNEIAFQSEIIQHGTPSGIDNSVITYEKSVFFQKNKPMEFLDLHKELFLVLADSDERSLTKDVLAFVREAMKDNPKNYNRIFQEIGIISLDAKDALITGNYYSIGNLMIENHHCLKNMGVSSLKLDQLVQTAMDAGAFGAKLCGAGKGGFMVALCERSKQKYIAEQLRLFSSNVIETRL